MPLSRLAALFLFAFLLAVIVAFPSRGISLYGDIYRTMAKAPLAGLTVVDYASELRAIKMTDPNVNPRFLMEENARTRFMMPLLAEGLRAYSVRAFVALNYLLGGIFVILLCALARGVFTGFWAQAGAVAAITTSIPVEAIYQLGIGYVDALSLILETGIVACWLATFRALGKNETSTLAIGSIGGLLALLLVLTHEAGFFFLPSSACGAFLIAAEATGDRLFILSRERQSELLRAFFLMLVAPAIMFAFFIATHWDAWRLHSQALAGSHPLYYLVYGWYYTLGGTFFSFALWWAFLAHYVVCAARKGQVMVLFAIGAALAVVMTQYLFAVDTMRLAGASWPIVFAATGIMFSRYASMPVRYRKMAAAVVIATIVIPHVTMSANYVAGLVRGAPLVLARHIIR